MMCLRLASVCALGIGTGKRALTGPERDSKKDEAVVFIFIFATGGLLAWAACKPWIERYVEVGWPPSADGRLSD